MGESQICEGGTRRNTAGKLRMCDRALRIPCQLGSINESSTNVATPARKVVMIMFLPRLRTSQRSPVSAQPTQLYFPLPGTPGAALAQAPAQHPQLQQSHSFGCRRPGDAGSPASEPRTRWRQVRDIHTVSWCRQRRAHRQPVLRVCVADTHAVGVCDAQCAPARTCVAGRRPPHRVRPFVGTSCFTSHSRHAMVRVATRVPSHCLR